MIHLKEKLFNLPGIHDAHYAKDLIFQMLADVPSRIRISRCGGKTEFLYKPSE